MNEKVWTLVFIVCVAGLFSGVLIHAFMQPLPVFDGLRSAPTEQLAMQRPLWAAGNANITLTVRNVGTSDISVSLVRVRWTVPITQWVNDVIASNVTYGAAFSGTANTLSIGATGTITITEQFTSNVEYTFTVVSETGNEYTCVAYAS